MLPAAVVDGVGRRYQISKKVHSRNNSDFCVFVFFVCMCVLVCAVCVCLRARVLMRSGHVCVSAVLVRLLLGLFWAECIWWCVFGVGVIS